MQTYDVTILRDASVTLSVEAGGPEDAAEMALTHDMAVTGLCHHCSAKLDLGDPIGTIVSDGDRELLDDTPYTAQRERADAIQRELALTNRALQIAARAVSRLPVVELSGLLPIDDPDAVQRIMEAVVLDGKGERS